MICPALELSMLNHRLADPGSLHTDSGHRDDGARSQQINSSSMSEMCIPQVAEVTEVSEKFS